MQQRLEQVLRLALSFALLGAQTLESVADAGEYGCVRLFHLLPYSSRVILAEDVLAHGFPFFLRYQVLVSAQAPCNLTMHNLKGPIGVGISCQSSHVQSLVIVREL